MALSNVLKDMNLCTTRSQEAILLFAWLGFAWLGTLLSTLTSLLSTLLRYIICIKPMGDVLADSTCGFCVFSKVKFLY